MWHDSNMLIATQQWPFHTLHACSLPIQQQHSWRDPPYTYTMICSRHGMIYNMQMSHDRISISTLGEHPANSCRHVLVQLYRYAYGLVNFLHSKYEQVTNLQPPYERLFYVGSASRLPTAQLQKDTHMGL